MSKVARYAVPAATLLLALAALGSRVGRPAPADPCEATPEIHACAMFRQPEWMVQRAQVERIAAERIAAGRIAAARMPVAEPATTGALAATARPAIEATAGF